MHKVPPTFLQAMHRASAELGQALKSPEKATRCSGGGSVAWIQLVPFLYVALGMGMWLLQLGRRGSRQRWSAAVQPLPR